MLRFRRGIKLGYSRRLLLVVNDYLNLPRTACARAWIFGVSGKMTDTSATACKSVPVDRKPISKMGKMGAPRSRWPDRSVDLSTSKVGLRVIAPANRSW